MRGKKSYSLEYRFQNQLTLLTDLGNFQNDTIPTSKQRYESLDGKMLLIQYYSHVILNGKIFSKPGHKIQLILNL
jgi:hypothetical protein